MRLLICLLMVVMLLGCDKDKEKSTDLIRPVKTMIVGEKKIKAMRSFPGKVLPHKEATLSFQVTGQIIQLSIREGQEVKKGDWLADLDPKKYKEHVAEMRARYLHRKSEYLRASSLVKGGHISKSAYDARKAAYEVAEANLTNANHDLRDTKLYAPFHGVIAKKYVENYEYVKAKQPIAELHDISSLDVEIYVPENVMIHIKEGHVKKVYATFESVPGKKFPLVFKELSTKADADTQTYRVKLTTPASENLNILPGMTVTVQAVMPDYSSGQHGFYLVPASAVFVKKDNQPMVWKVDVKTMTVHAVPVSITRLDDGNIRITDGLHSGDHIVTSGVHFLRANQAVKVKTKENNHAQ